MQYIQPANYLDILGKSLKSYAKQLEPVCKKWNLTRNELDVILFLYNNPEFDRASDIVSRRGIAKSHVSMSVASLEERSLLEKCFSENDRRISHLKLTEAAIEIAAEGKAAQQAFFEILFGNISKSEMEILDSITGKVSQNLDKLI